jgi:hypothetical protein
MDALPAAIFSGADLYFVTVPHLIALHYRQSGPTRDGPVAQDSDRVALGLALGIFVGERAALLEPVADAYVKLLQMTVLPT